MIQSSEHFDVIVVGAGISGIGAAYHLKTLCPEKSFVVLERRENLGGTWDLFKYPGIRSDSDMYTFGYSFHPWTKDKLVAPAEDILAYLQEVVGAYGIDDHMRFGEHIDSAAFSSDAIQWRLVTKSGKTYTCSFLFLNTGYYRYEEGYTPSWPGKDLFQGRVVHPQAWPSKVDYKGKKVVVIGSGATAATIVPVLAEEAEKVTMLQRSPGYYVTLPAAGDPLARWLRPLSSSWAHAAGRCRAIVFSMLGWYLSKLFPTVARKVLMAHVKEQVPSSFDVDTHFNPRYDPWDQRICLIADGDFFHAIRNGTADVVTDTIEAFTEAGLRLKSGNHLEADLIITATGLNLQRNFPMSDISVTVDGVAYDAPKTLMYKGVMLSDVPNLAFTMGYANVSWTLKADLVSGYVCRLLNHMGCKGYKCCIPRRGDAEVDQTHVFFDLSANYLKRVQHRMPKQAGKPWRLYQNYFLDLFALKFGSIEDGIMEFSKPLVARL